MGSSILIPGIDCAAQAKNIGVGVGESRGGCCRVQGAFKCAQLPALIERVASVASASSPVLLALDLDRGAMLADDDVIDAAVCVLAGHDFLTGKARAPEEVERYRREGWIWARDPA